MPKNILKALAAVLVLLCILSSSIVSANFIPTEAQIQILSPMKFYLKLYQNTPVWISAEIREPLSAPQHYHEITSVYYVCDDQQPFEITNITQSKQSWFSGECTRYLASALLPPLKDGTHQLRVYSVDDAGNQLTATTTFAYNKYDDPPQVTIASPQNRSYPALTSELPLTIYADEFDGASIVLDNQMQWRKLIRDNTTLNDLTNGQHKLLITVYTHKGVLTDSVLFSVGDSLPSSDSAQTLQGQPTSNQVSIIAVVCTAIAIISATAVYFKRRKSKLLSQER